MAIYRLQRKSFATLADGTGKSIMDFKKDWQAQGGEAKLGKFADWYRGAGTSDNLKAARGLAENGQSAAQVMSQTGFAKGQGTGALAATNNQINAAATQRATERAARQAVGPDAFKNVATKAQTKGFQKGMQAGQKSVSGLAGAKTWVGNTWNSGMKGKAGLIGAGIVAAGVTTAAIANGVKKNKLKKENENLKAQLNKGY